MSDVRTERKPIIAFKNPIGDEAVVAWVPPEVEEAIKAVTPPEPSLTPEQLEEAAEYVRNSICTVCGYKENADCPDAFHIAYNHVKRPTHDPQRPPQAAPKAA